MSRAGFVWSPRGSGWLRGAVGARSFSGALLQDAMKACRESSTRVCPPGDGPRLVERFGVTRVVARVSDSAWA